MNGNRLRAAILLVCLSLSTTLGGEPVIAKRALRVDPAENLLQADGWRPCQSGFTGDTRTLVCDNCGDGQARRGVQTVQLDQTRPEPIVASVFSKAEGVSGSPDSDYSLYLDLVYNDGTPLWGQAASFATGTHDWQWRQVMVLPEKPVKCVTLYLLLRGHGGKACFRDARLGVIPTPPGACLFDGVPVVPASGYPAGGVPAVGCREGFQIRDVAAGSDYLAIEPRSAGYENPAYMTAENLGIRLVWYSRPAHSPDRGRLEGATLYNLSVYDTTGKDRAITLLYTVPVAAKSLRWLGGSRESTAVQEGREYLEAARFRVGSNGRLSRYPFAAVADASRGIALGSLPLHPAFCRTGYNAGTGELFVAWDIGLAAEKQRAELEFCQFTFEPQWGFRAAWRDFTRSSRAFRCRTPQQGLWMPFAKISQVRGMAGFRLSLQGRQRRDRVGRPARHSHLPLYRADDLVDAHAQGDAAHAGGGVGRGQTAGRARQPGGPALFTSGYHDADGRFVARLQDTPWCNGAAWSMNSMPGILGEMTDFKNKWNCEDREGPLRVRSAGKGPRRRVRRFQRGLRDRRAGFPAGALRRGRNAAGVLAGRAPAGHLSRPDRVGVRPRPRQRDIARDRLMMANGTPGSLWWLAPMLDVMGTETDWNPGGRWQPMSDAELLYRRALCKGKPYCFLMNTPSTPSRTPWSRST